ncbi:hypothetical protein [Polaribacter atrinae]|nr:hypothetical protein [Polaribacter atrinae]
MTKDKPVIKAYEDYLAKLNESKYAPIFLSIDALKALLSRYGYLFYEN